MQQVWTFLAMVLGHLVVLQLSIQWVTVILKLGLRNFLVFTPVVASDDDKTVFDWRASAFSAQLSPSSKEVSASGGEEEQSTGVDTTTPPRDGAAAAASEDAPTGDATGDATGDDGHSSNMSQKKDA